MAKTSPPSSLSPPTISPPSIPVAAMPVSGLVLVMIMRDEARCIERCLASVSPWVERMVVVDTGSSDDSVALARRAGAEVHQRDWPDDFAAARNQALDLAGDYRYALVLDADEWLVSGAALLGGFVARHAGGPPLPAGRPIGVLRVDSRFSADGQERLSPAWLPRLLPSGIRYQGRIHEQPIGGAGRERLEITLKHDGYEPRQLAGKRQRNRDLLLAELACSPEDAYLHYQLGKDAAVHEDWAAACEGLERARTLSTPGDPWLHDLLIRSLVCYKRLGRLQDGLTLAADCQHLCEDSPDFHFTVGDLALDCAVAHPELAVETFFAMIEQHWLRALTLGDRPDLPGAVIGHGSFLAAHNLGVFYRLLGNTERADHYEALARQLRDERGLRCQCSP